MVRVDIEQNTRRIEAKPVSKFTNYFLQFQLPTLKDHKVTTICDFVVKNGPDCKIEEAPKCNAKAKVFRTLGNEHYLKKEYEKALESYNQSLCFAEASSEDMGIAFANRSAVYLDMGLHKLCLKNIAMAKANNYPQRLMEKLLKREKDSLAKMKTVKKVVHKPELKLSYPSNPNIPYIVDKIKMENIPFFDRSMVADRNFKVGDVLMIEKPLVNSPGAEYKYSRCDYCACKMRLHLIPCPSCTSAMFCSQECLDQSMETCHKYECGLLESLQFLSKGSTKVYIGLRLLWLALSQFDGNVEEFIKFVKNTDHGDNPFKLNLKQKNVLGQLSVFNSSKYREQDDEYDTTFSFFSALYYSVIIKHAPIKFMFKKDDHKEVLAEILTEYIKKCGFKILRCPDVFSSQYFTIGSTMNHSCVPNVASLYKNNKMKVVAIRPIAKGAQIMPSYGVKAADLTLPERILANTTHYLFVCLCEGCRGFVKTQGQLEYSLDLLSQTQAISTCISSDNREQKLKKLQAFLQKNDKHYPSKELYIFSAAYVAYLLELMEKQTEEAQMEKITI